MLPSQLSIDERPQSREEIRQQLLASIQRWIDLGEIEVPLLLTPSGLGVWEATNWCSEHTELLDQLLCDLLGATSLLGGPSGYGYYLSDGEELRVFRCCRHRLDLYVRKALGGCTIFYLVEMGG